MTAVRLGEAAREFDEEGSAGRAITCAGVAEHECIAELRARLAADRTLDTDGIELVFRDGALHLRGRVPDERTWFAIVNLASTFASQIVDRIQLERRSPSAAAHP